MRCIKCEYICKEESHFCPRCGALIEDNLPDVDTIRNHLFELVKPIRSTFFISKFFVRVLLIFIVMTMLKYSFSSAKSAVVTVITAAFLFIHGVLGIPIRKRGIGEEIDFSFEYPYILNGLHFLPLVLYALFPYEGEEMKKLLIKSIVISIMLTISIILVKFVSLIYTKHKSEEIEEEFKIHLNSIEKQ